MGARGGVNMTEGGGGGSGREGGVYNDGGGRGEGVWLTQSCGQWWLGRGEIA